MFWFGFCFLFSCFVLVSFFSQHIILLPRDLGEEKKKKQFTHRIFAHIYSFLSRSRKLLCFCVLNVDL